jgi:phosphoribosyl 1,2-cyclic phosphodiesterase
MSKPGLTTISVRFRGVRGSTPSPGLCTARYGGNTACVELRAGDEILILDAGSGIRALGADLGTEFGSRPIKATLLISHTHWDHIQGLPFFTPAFSTKNRIRVIAAKGAGATLERALRNQMDPIHFPVGLDQMPGLNCIEELRSDKVSLGAFTVHVAELNHPGGCAGFRVEAHGASLAYLPDHEPFEIGYVSASGSSSAQARTDALVEFVRGVDLLILDTQYTAAEYRHRRGWGHGSLPDSVSLALNADVRQFALFHHDPGHDDDQIDAMLESARNMARPSALAVKGASENEMIALSPVKVQLRSVPFRNLIKSAAAA